SKYIETSDEWEYTQRIYSCTFDGCEVIKEEMDDCYICGGPLFDLETYNNDLYEMDVAVGGVYNKLSKSDENSKQWTVVLDMGTHSNWESLVSNNEHLGLSYVKETDNGEMLYLNLLTGDQIQTEIYELPKDLYNGYSSFSVDPILYNDHIAIPVRKENSSTCNYLIYTDEYEEMENTVPCRFDSIMISDELYLSINDSFSTSRYVNHSINKISDDIVESNVIDIDGIQLSRLDNFFYVINENTVLDMGNHDGKWYIIHMQ
ncbi:MAG: hypothetical protein IJP28_06555, partial [Erysipelotrichales bacterium]|nr:hypothetical protein [Erysipelotrichales bacterium]